MVNHSIPEELWAMVPPVPGKTAVSATRRYLDGGPLSITHDLTWEGDLADIFEPDWSRADGRKAHSWFFLGFWTAAHSKLNPDERELLLKDVRRALASWRGHSSHPDSMAFHDETTAQRAMSWALFVRAYDADLDGELRDELADLILEHARLLATEDFYAGLNNHGMFQGIAILVVAALGFTGDERKTLGTVAFDRLVDYFESCFTQDGVHTENSPSYHLMVARYLRQVINYGVAVGEETRFEHLSQISELADRYAAFALSPSGKFVPVSDTNSRGIAESTARDTFGEGFLLGAVSLGESGKLPAEQAFVAAESGYAVHRSGWTSREDSYLFFSAAYNADYHKHSDELSLFFRSGGRDLLMEAGPNGYEYSDPHTKYGFSGWAHNSMIVDGESLPRVDDGASLTWMADNGSTAESLDVTGTTKRYQGVEWSRRLRSDDTTGPEMFTIEDRVVSAEEHTYTFIWHMAPGIDAQVRGNAIEMFDEQTHQKVGELTWTGSPSTSVRLINGQETPRVQGWHFPSMGSSVPVDVVEVDIVASGAHLIWEMRTTDFLIKDRGITPYSEWQVFEGEKPVRYLLQFPDAVGDHEVRTKLAIVFSAISEPWDFTYNYFSSMEGFDGAVLYVLDDFGDQGSYYLANGREFAEYRSVQGLLTNIMESADIAPSDIITLGSSKGGTAAVIHGVAIGARQVYAGGPQYRIGDFLDGVHNNVLRYITGGETSGDIRWLNQAAKKFLSSGSRATRITVLVGENDHHYKNHAVPLIDDARALGYSAELLAIPGTPHSELGQAFRDFVRSMIPGRQEDDEFTLPSAVGLDTEKGIFGVCVALPDGWEAVAQLFRGREKVGDRVRLRDGMAQWEVDQPGRYIARVYAEVPGEESRRGFRAGERTF